MHISTLLRSRLRRDFGGQALRTALFLFCAWLLVLPTGSAQSGDDCSDTTNVSVTLPKDTTIIKGTKATLVVVSPNAELTVVWMSGNDTLSGNTLSVMPEKTTTFIVTATVGDCVFSDSVTVEVIEEFLQMPNAFTPNGDDVNDLLRPAMLGYTLLQLEVWGRWGEKVYDSTLDNQNKGWNGIFNDKPAPAEAYFYRVLIRRTADGTTVVRNSNVTLLR